MSNINKIVGLVVIIGLLSIFSSYMFGILSENDDQINVTGTGYEQAYESNTKVQSGTSELLTPISFILGALIVFFGLKMFIK